MRTIQLRDAKAGLSQVVDDAMQGEPSLITRHGKPQAVVLSFDEWKKLSSVPSFGRLLMAAPEALAEFTSRNSNPSRNAGL
jgi:antitoxin Phd